jgi:hypothetical protein
VERPRGSEQGTFGKYTKCIPDDKNVTPRKSTKALRTLSGAGLHESEHIPLYRSTGKEEQIDRWCTGPTCPRLSAKYCPSAGTTVLRCLGMNGPAHFGGYQAKHSGCANDRNSQTVFCQWAFGQRWILAVKPEVMGV